MRAQAARILSLCGVAVLWHVCAIVNERARIISPKLLPTPYAVLMAAGDLQRFLSTDMSASLSRVLVGFLLGASAGVFLGCLELRTI
jgi:ABC-type nitrate/sulfonate/bicarbonate transport system permease component